MEDMEYVESMEDFDEHAKRNKNSSGIGLLSNIRESWHIGTNQSRNNAREMRNLGLNFFAAKDSGCSKAGFLSILPHIFISANNGSNRRGKPRRRVRYPSDNVIGVDVYGTLKSKLTLQHALPLTCTAAVGKHPHFVVKCHGNEGQIWETKRRFAAFRDFMENVIAIQPDLIKAKFPPTIASSAYGIQLSEKQLSERRSLLREWLQEIVDKYDQLANDDFRTSLFRLLRGESASFQISLEDKALSKESFSRSAQTKPTPTPNVDINTLQQPFSQQGKALKTVLTRRGSSNALIESSPDSGPVLASPAVENIFSGIPMTVRVSRGKLDNGHQTYETVINVGEGHRPYIVTKFFKDYRQLALDLKQEGVSVGHVDREDDSSSCSRGAGPHALPPFPPTYKRSMIGIALDEEHTSMRCRGLDAWMRALLVLYHTLLLPSVQALVDRFLNLRADSDKPIHKIILNSLLENGVVKPSITSIPTVNFPPPVLKLEEKPVDSAGVDSAGEGTSSTSTDNKPVRRGSLLDKLWSRNHFAEGAEDGKPAPSVAVGNVSGDTGRVKRGKKGSKERELYEASEAERAAHEAKRKEEERVKEMHTLSVAVVRGSIIGGHPSYDVKITFERAAPPHVISKKYFKDFRQLALDISNEGVPVVSVDAAGISVSITSDLTGGSDTPNALIQKQQQGGASSNGDATLPPFPRTYKRSSIGIGLPEADLQARSNGLDKWLRALMRAYHSYSPRVQGIINSFIEIDTDETGTFREIVIHRGYVDQPTRKLSDTAPTPNPTTSSDAKEAITRGESNTKPASTVTTVPDDAVGAAVTSMKGSDDAHMTSYQPGIDKFIKAKPIAPSVVSIPTHSGGGCITAKEHNIENAATSPFSVSLDASSGGRAEQEWIEITSIPTKENSSTCVPGCVMS